MTTKTMTDVDQKSSITSDANCNVSLVNGRREAIHAPTGPSSLAINKNIVEALRGCNMSIQAIDVLWRTDFHSIPADKL